MNEQHNQNLMLSKEDINFFYENPRFSGMDVALNNPDPYVHRMDDMMNSMVETYKKTGYLLLQPIVMEETPHGHSVRAGFTRAMTFIHKYDEMCTLLGVDSLTIEARIFTGLESSDALMENMMRSDQHYMSIAHALHKMVKGGATSGKLSKQLGMSVARINNLVSLVDNLISTLMSKCYDSIHEHAAVALSQLNKAVQGRIFTYMEEEEVQVVKNAEDVKRLMHHSVDTIGSWVPREAFTAIDGTEFPPLEEEEWCIAGDMFSDFITLDMSSTIHRAQQYWLMMVETHKIVVKEDNSCYDTTVEMGTHPSEYGVWKDVWCDNPETGERGRISDVYLAFYVKESDLDKLNLDRRLKERTNSIETRSTNKAVNLVQKEKQKLKMQLMNEVRAMENPNNIELLKHAAVKLVMHMSEGALGMLSDMMGKEVTYKTASTFDPTELLEAIGFCDIYLYSGSSTAEKYLSANKKDFNKAWKKVEKNINEEKESIKAGAEDKIKETEDLIDDIRAFFYSLSNIMYIHTEPASLYRMVTEGLAPEKVMKYVAKGLGIPYSGSEGLMQYRLASAVKYMEEKMNIVIVEQYEEQWVNTYRIIEGCLSFELSLLDNTGHIKPSEFLEDVRKKVVEKYAAFYEINTEGQFYSAIHNKDKSAILKVIAKQDMDIEEWKVNIINSCIPMFVDYLDENFELPYQVMYLQDNNKLRILG